MSTEVLLNETTRLTVTFYEWATDGGEPVNPGTVQGFIKDANLTVLSTFTPTNTAVGVYLYDWTPAVLGTYYVEFKGTYADTTVDVIRDEFNVVAVIAGDTTEELGADQYLFWMTELDPMYLDPDEVTEVYPDASKFELAEFIFIYSTEVKDLLGLQDDEVPPGIALDYIRASVLCSLSRIYDNSFGMGDAITLGDLQIDGKRFSREFPNRGNVGSWCELAALLRNEMLRVTGKGPGIRAIVKGEAYPNPMPIRSLRSLDN